MDWSQVIWIFSYISVLLGLSAFGIHRYLMIFLYLKNGRKEPSPVGRFAESDLPVITVQLPDTFRRSRLLIRSMRRLSA